MFPFRDFSVRVKAQHTRDRESSQVKIECLDSPTLWIFEDQLSARLLSLRTYRDAPVLMIESRIAFTFVPYHKRRLTFLISAMRHFAEELRQSREVHYYALISPSPCIRGEGGGEGTSRRKLSASKQRQPRRGPLPNPLPEYREREGGYLDSLGALRDYIDKTGRRNFIIVEPSEYHTRAWLVTLPKLLGIEIEFVPNTLFLTDREDFAAWAKSVKSPVMEFFYRRMRKKHDVLMHDGLPVGGQWNLDALNRKPLAKGVLVPPVPRFAPDAITLEAIRDVDAVFPNHPGSTSDFDLPVTHADAKIALKDFIKNRLPLFGDFEDAMSSDEPHLFHSQLSVCFNAGLLEPMKAIRAAENALRKGKAPLNSVEGFIRQLLGWREYVYGIYWSFMPEYRMRNSRGETRSLPQFFWDGQTEMNCLHHAIGNVLREGWSHHIQRLMVICNFATLAGLSPQEMNDWFLAMYIDSHDWVVTPNVIGMAMNSDDNTIATKPYVSSAAYINRMSDYCKPCRYDPMKRLGDNACPFNYLYWTFMDRQRAALTKVPRMFNMLKNLDRIASADLKQMHSASEQFIQLNVRPYSSARGLVPKASASANPNHSRSKAP